MAVKSVVLLGVVLLSALVFLDVAYAQVTGDNGSGRNVGTGGGLSRGSNQYGNDFGGNRGSYQNFHGQGYGYRSGGNRYGGYFSGQGRSNFGGSRARPFNGGRFRGNGVQAGGRGGRGFFGGRN